MTTLDAIRADASPFPTDILDGCETALILFAAAFLGRNDAIHIADAGIQATCVDSDPRRLADMWAMYPGDWHFITSDAWGFAGLQQQGGAHYDLVTVDTFTGGTMERALRDLPLWCSLARKAVLVTCTPQALRDVEIPGGWWGRMFERASNGSHWLVLQKIQPKEGRDAHHALRS